MSRQVYRNDIQKMFPASAQRDRFSIIAEVPMTAVSGTNFIGQGFAFTHCNGSAGVASVSGGVTYTAFAQSPATKPYYAIQRASDYNNDGVTLYVIQDCVINFEFALAIFFTSGAGNRPVNLALYILEKDGKRRTVDIASNELDTTGGNSGVSIGLQRTLTLKAGDQVMPRVFANGDNIAVQVSSEDDFVKFPIRDIFLTKSYLITSIV